MEVSAYTWKENKPWEQGKNLPIFKINCNFFGDITAELNPR